VGGLPMKGPEGVLTHERPGGRGPPVKGPEGVLTHERPAPRPGPIVLGVPPPFGPNKIRGGCYMHRQGASHVDST